jgi:anaerobic ribonucleoside-triphosphate reductase activating protein
MLKFVSYDIVFQEVPDEVTLAINISGCPNHCKGCHSPYLMEDIGERLSCEVLAGLLMKYKESITCVCFMGGDSAPVAVDEFAAFVKRFTSNKVKTAWYSGSNHFPENCTLENFNYIKLGPYIERLGGLDSPNTNQHFFKIDNNNFVDCTSLSFQREHAFALT